MDRFAAARNGMAKEVWLIAEVGSANLGIHALRIRLIHSKIGSMTRWHRFVVAGVVFLVPTVVFAAIWLLLPVAARLTSNDTTHTNFVILPKWPLAVTLMVGIVLLVIGLRGRRAATGAN